MGSQKDLHSDLEARNVRFVRLLKQHERRVAACVYALVPDWNVAEDILQDTWVKLWEQFDEYRSGEDFGAWACTIARYLVLAHYKRLGRQRLQFRSETMDLIVSQVNADCEISKKRLETLVGCIRRLDTAAKNLLYLCYTEGLKIKDIASKLGRSVNATYLMLSRTRRQLHDCIEKTLLSEEAGHD